MVVVVMMVVVIKKGRSGREGRVWHGHSDDDGGGGGGGGQGRGGRTYWLLAWGGFPVPWSISTGLENEGRGEGFV